MCSDVFAHAESAHPFFLGQNNTKACVTGRGIWGVVTTPLQVFGCTVKVGVLCFWKTCRISVCSFLYLGGRLDLTAASSNSRSSSIIETLQCFHSFFPRLPSFGIRMLANYKCNLANQRYCWSRWGNHKLHCAGESIYYHITRFPTSLSVSCRHKSIFALRGNHGNGQFDSTLAALCITVCRTSNESLIRLGSWLFQFVCAHFYKGIKRVCVRTGTRLYEPSLKTKYTYFLLVSFTPNQKKTKKHFRHNLQQISW